MAQRIRIVSPSGVIDPALIDGAALQLEKEGFEVVIGEHARGAYGRFAGTEEERISDLHKALHDAHCSFVLCGRGGYGLSQIVDKIEVPDGSCPVVIGFSDITALHNLMGHHRKPSLHGVMCKHVCEGLAEGKDGRLESAEALLQVMRRNDIHYSVPAHACNKIGEVTGVLRGGNLSIIYALQATPYDCPVQEGDILFIEDIGEHPYAIDRMMHNLRLSGMLAKLGGLIVGQFSNYEEDNRMPYTVYQGIRRMVDDYDYPVLFDFPAGHVERNLPLIMNAPCTISVSPTQSTFSQKHL